MTFLLDNQKDGSKDQFDDLLFGRGAPALMSDKEPAIHGLRKRYSESFAITKGNGQRIHLFLIKFGMWSLVWTFTPRDFGLASATATVEQTLELLDDTMIGKNSAFLSRLDRAVANSKRRIENKAEDFGYRRS